MCSSVDYLATNKKILYIHEYINELKKEHRKEILQILVDSQIPENKISEKGGGTQIHFSAIPVEYINIIYTSIKNKIEKNDLII